MSILKWLGSLIWPEPRYRNHIPPTKVRVAMPPVKPMKQDYGRITEGKEIRGGVGKYPTGPKPKVKVVAQKQNRHGKK